MYLFYKESDNGNIEYKLHLLNLNNFKIEKYSTQLMYRILEGSGIAIYIIGINNDGKLYGIQNNQINYTIRILNKICMNVNCKIDIILQCKYKNIYFLIIKIISCFNINDLPFLI